MRKNDKNYGEKTTRGKLVKIMLSEGLITSEGIQVIEGNRIRNQRALKRMKDEGIAESVYVGRGSKGTYLVGVENKGQEYLEQMPVGYYKKYKEKGIENYRRLLKTNDAAVKQRAVRNSNAVCMMHGAGVSVLPDEKQELNKTTTISLPSYYASTEIKEAAKAYMITTKAPDENTFTNARAMGYMCTESMMYPIYVVENKMVKFVSNETEIYGYRMAQKVYAQKGYRTDSDQIDCLVFAQDDNVFEKMMFPAQGTYDYIRKNIFTCEQSIYRRVIALPYSPDGRDLLTYIAMTRSWEKKLVDNILGYRIKPRTNITCDGMQGDVHEFVFCVPDLMRFVRFARVAKDIVNHNQFKVYCFPWQTNFIRRMLNHNEADIEEVDTGILKGAKGDT